MIKAIDVHAHCGDPKYFPQKGLAKEFLKFNPAKMAEEFAQQDIVAAFLSPMEGLYARDADELKLANERTAKLTEEYEGFYFWVVVHPDLPQSFLRAELLLEHPKCVGVKIHPEFGGYDINSCGSRIFSFCNEFKVPLLTHTGEPGCMPEDFVLFADRFPEVPVILAHLGHSFDGHLVHQVNALKCAAGKNMYIDLSSSASLQCGLIEWAAEHVGADRLLFGSDAPLHHPAMMKARIEGAAGISREDKELMLFGNAAKLIRN